MLDAALYKPNSFLLSKIESLKARTELLTGLNKVVPNGFLLIIN